jgi:hypothetical protein
MIRSPGSSTSSPGFARGEFYVTGGTLRPDAPSYVERQADRDLWEGLLQGEFCYVLTSRQMGKSSLMVRTVKRLREEGVAVAVLDLTAIGQNLTIAQWYDGLISRLGQQLDLEDELFEFWSAHQELGPLQRWLNAIEEVVLKRIPGRVVVFVDEIDIVRSLAFSTDEFFAAIREAYNRRSRDPAFHRLSFGLLGVATPTDLIRDTRMTPFNIGRRVELNDFTADEAEPLARGLGPDPYTSKALLQRILFWTGGHPYLTQRLCRALAETVSRPQDDPETPPLIPTWATVDELADRLFLSRQARDRDDNLIFVRERILRSEVDVPGLLYLYRRIRNGERVPDDETNPLISVLRLSGIIRGREGLLHVRNRIYDQVFDQKWIQTNMPEAETRRQRSARRRGVMIGLGIGIALLLGYLLLGPVIRDYRQSVVAQRTIRHIDQYYRGLSFYRDTFESTLEIAVGDVTVPVKGVGSILFEQPNRVSLALKSDFNKPEIEMRLLSDGKYSWAFVPELRQYQVLDSPMSGQFRLPPSLARHFGPQQLLPFYRIFLDEKALEQFRNRVQNLHYTSTAEMEGERVRVLSWRHSAEQLLAPLGVTNFTHHNMLPMTIWVGEDHRVVQIQADLSYWAGELVPNPENVPVNGLILTERHHTMPSQYVPVQKSRFVFLPGFDFRPVAEFDLPEQTASVLNAVSTRLKKLIPSRLAYAPEEAIDLTSYYNAALVKAWHPGAGGNSLEGLPKGLLQLGEVVFDVRGVVQLSGKELRKAGGRYPEAVRDIRIVQHARQLHFLHACGWKSSDGTQIGSYIVRYENGHTLEVPIVYGYDVRDWNADTDPAAGLKRGRQVWSAVNNARFRVRLFETIWVNPLPEEPIESIDFVSKMAPSAPFLVGLTVEP